MQSLDRVEKSFSKSNNLDKEIPEFKAGDKIVVRSKIKEGDKERVQAFEGVVIARSGRNTGATFTVRKVSGGVGVERIFPLYSPNIVSIERKTEGYVRRAKLYYIRDLDGKAARIQDKNIRLMAAQGGAAEEAESEAPDEVAATGEGGDTADTPAARAPKAAKKSTKKSK